MSIRMENARSKKIVAAILVWLLTAMLLLSISALLIGRMKLGSQWIGAASAAVVAVSSAAASIVLYRGRKGGRRWMPALLLWLVIASTLLMLGFLIDSDAMSLTGLARVLVCSLLGSICGTLIKGTAKRKAMRGRTIS